MQLLQTGGGNDTLIRESWDKIGTVNALFVFDFFFMFRINAFQLVVFI